MKVFRGLGELPGRPAASAVTVGNFYAIHKGHRALIRRVHRLAKQAGLAPTVVTFEPHPQKVLHGEAACLLVTPQSKLELLEQAGISQVVVLRFTKTFSRTEPEDFIERVLLALNLKALVVGADFRFGRFARGDATMLRAFARDKGFAFEPVRLVETAGRRISSTEIRHALRAGDLQWANRALGRPYAVSGKVVHGSGRGRKMGYPTANLRTSKDLCIPADGIYAGRMVAGRIIRPAAVSIGRNLMFGETALTVEAHALDFRGVLYGRTARFELVARIRDHVQFPDSGALREAIDLDVAAVRRLVRL